MSLPDAFRLELDRCALPAGPVVVAVSGGPDSVALLDLLAMEAPARGLVLIVAHADHGIDPASGRVAATVAALAASYGVRCEIGRLQLGSDASETGARAARYAWLLQVADAVGADDVLTAHHADDQAETVLMRVLAGTGPAGLAGMAPRHGRIVRPLLSFRSADLLKHVAARGLPTWDDPANTNPVHLRSWLRRDVLPGLAARLPDLTSRLTRSARLAQQDRAGWDAVLELLPGLGIEADASGVSVAAPPLAGYDSALSEAIVRALGRRLGAVIGERAAAAVVRLARGAASGRSASLPGGFRAELSMGRLRVYRDEPIPGTVPLPGSAGEQEWAGWVVRWRPDVAPGRHPRTGTTAWITPGTLVLRAPRAGERVRPVGGAGGRPLARCFLDARVQRSRRGDWPVIGRGEDALWVPGVCRADLMVPAKDSEALRVDATYA